MKKLAMLGLFSAAALLQACGGMNTHGSVSGLKDNGDSAVSKILGKYEGVQRGGLFGGDQACTIELLSDRSLGFDEVKIRGAIGKDTYIYTTALPSAIAACLVSGASEFSQKDVLHFEDSGFKEHHVDSTLSFDNGALVAASLKDSMSFLALPVPAGGITTIDCANLTAK